MIVGPHPCKSWEGRKYRFKVHEANWVPQSGELAREFGVGTAFVRDSNHYGASGYWARLPLRHNMIGFSFTTASARIAPWGGKEGLVGNNPPAWAVPSRIVAPDTDLSAAEADSVFLDIALSPLQEALEVAIFAPDPVNQRTPLRQPLKDHQ